MLPGKAFKKVQSIFFLPVDVEENSPLPNVIILGSFQWIMLLSLDAYFVLDMGLSYVISSVKPHQTIISSIL